MTTVTKKKTTTTKAASLELPRNPFVFEVLDLVSKQRSKAKKIEVLKKQQDFLLDLINEQSKKQYLYYVKLFL